MPQQTGCAMRDQRQNVLEAIASIIVGIRYLIANSFAGKLQS
jgi:hypothetical protein